MFPTTIPSPVRTLGGEDREWLESNIHLDGFART